MSAQQKKLFILKTKVGSISQAKVGLPQPYTSRKIQQQRNSTKLPKNNEDKNLFSPIVYIKQKTVLNFSTIGLDDFIKNVVKYHTSRSFDGLDYRKFKIKSQDCIISKTMIGEGNGKHFFILNDSHGTSGLLIAKLVGQSLESQYNDFIQKLDQNNIKDEKIKQEIVQMYKTTDEQLNQQFEIDCSQSGTSNISLFIIGDQMLCSNCGDSKALFFYKNDFLDQSLHLWKIKQLQSEHIPTQDQEFMRIKSQNGKIDQKLIRGKKQGNLLVWSKLKTDQGVHVTRCFGNQLQKTVGVIVDPDISYFKFPKSGYLIIASQSLWNYLDNFDIGQILNQFNPPKSQSELIRIENEIINHANHYWDSEHDGIQDISIMIIYIDLKL